MHRVLLLSTAPVLLGACSSGTASSDKSAEKDPRQKVARAYQLSYSEPAVVDSTAWRYQQVGWSRQERAAFESDSYGSSSGYQNEAFNVLFIGPSGQDVHLLLPHSRFLITEIDTKAHPEARWPFIFYKCIITDSNKDQQLNSEDALALLASDRQGRNLLQITPDTASAEGWQVAPDHSLLVALRLDSNRDNTFGYKDEVKWFRYDLRNLRAAPTPLLPSGLHAQLQQQLIDHHLQYPKGK